jgi:hypothetical protein
MKVVAHFSNVALPLFVHASRESHCQTTVKRFARYCLKPSFQKTGPGQLSKAHTSDRSTMAVPSSCRDILAGPEAHSSAHRNCV